MSESFVAASEQCSKCGMRMLKHVLVGVDARILWHPETHLVKYVWWKCLGQPGVFTAPSKVQL